MKLGFTLAEVLVTLGIIGVVSAMTLPTLVKNHQRQVYVTQLHKAYNDLTQAVDSYTTSKNAVNLNEAGGMTDAESVKRFVQNEFKVVKFCSATEPCFASSYKLLDGSSVDDLGESFIENAFVTPAGYVMSIDPGWIVMVDINGQAGPNIMGRDFFTMVLDPVHNTVGSNANDVDKDDLMDMCQTQGVGCFTLIQNAGWKMDY